MSADALQPPQWQAAGVPRYDLGGVIEAAVDVYDAAAHLEASGISDGAARRAGFASTFDQAHALWSGRGGARPAAPARSGPVGGGLGPAIDRVLVMLAGVVICLTGTPGGLPGSVLFWAGAGGWLAGQVVSAATWSGLGSGRRDVAVGNALRAVVLGLGLSVALAAIAGHAIVVGWALWGMSASVLLILGPTRRFALAALPAAAAMAVLIRLDRADEARLLAAAAVLVAVVVAGELLRRGRGARGLGPAGLRIRRAVSLATAQTVAMLAILWILVGMVGGASFTAVAVAGLVAAAVTDLVLEVAHRRLEHIVGGRLSWYDGQRETARVGVLAMTVVVVGAVTGMYLGSAWLGTPASATVLGGTALVAALTGGCGLLLRSGSAEGATALAVAAAFLTLLVLPLSAIIRLDQSMGLLAVSVASCLTAIAVAARVLSQPSSW